MQPSYLLFLCFAVCAVMKDLPQNGRCASTQPLKNIVNIILEHMGFAGPNCK